MKVTLEKISMGKAKMTFEYNGKEYTEVWEKK